MALFADNDDAHLSKDRVFINGFRLEHGVPPVALPYVVERMLGKLAPAFRRCALPIASHDGVVRTPSTQCCNTLG